MSNKDNMNQTIGDSLALCGVCLDDVLQLVTNVRGGFTRPVEIFQIKCLKKLITPPKDALASWHCV